MFDAAQYLALKNSVISLTKNEDIIQVEQKQFSSLDGTPLSPIVTFVNILDLQQRIDAFQDYISNTSAFITDAQ